MRDGEPVYGAVEMLDRVNRVLIVSAQAFSNVLLALMMAAIFVEVISRYLLHQSHGFMEEFSKWSQIWIAYLMLGIVERERGHIKVDIIYNYLPPRGKILLLIVFDAATLVFSVVLFLSGLEATVNLYRLGSASTSGVPVPLWTIMLATPIGAVLLAALGALNLADTLRSLLEEKK